MAQSFASAEQICSAKSMELPKNLTVLTELLEYPVTDSRQCMNKYWTDYTRRGNLYFFQDPQRSELFNIIWAPDSQ